MKIEKAIKNINILIRVWELEQADEEMQIFIHKEDTQAFNTNITLEKQINDGWIPVSERLPDMDECHKNDNRFIVTDGNRRYQDWFDYKERHFVRCECNGLGLKKDKCVIAWQPLPPAYREVENE